MRGFAVVSVKDVIFFLLQKPVITNLSIQVKFSLICIRPFPLKPLKVLSSPLLHNLLYKRLSESGMTLGKRTRFEGLTVVADVHDVE